MQGTCVRHTDLPHTTRLFADYLYHFDRVAPFYAHSPHDPSSFERAAKQVQFPDERRTELVSALRAMNGGHPALGELARPGTFAVVTGQQVGLFSGPAYTIYKALTAAALARRLSAAGLPCVPVFWLATEDHDFNEANHCWVFDSAHRPVRLEIAGDGSKPVGTIPIQAAPIDGLRRALSDFAHGDEVADAVAACYAPGATMGAAFAGLLRRLLPSQGLLVFDPMHPESRRLGAPLMRRAVEQMPELTARVLERNRELTGAGYHAQVHVEEQTSFVFLLEGGERIPLRRDGQEYDARGRKISAAELIERAEQLSPNALLRPVMQDCMLPVVAYVGGPAELAYLAQSEVLYRQLLGRMPVAAPRQSATLLDTRSAKLFARYGLTLKDCLAGEDAVRERIASTLVPAEVKQAIDAARARASDEFDRLGAVLGRFDPTLGAAFAKSRRKMEYQLAKTERKATRAALQRNERAAAEAAYLSGLVYPEKHLQERFYSMLPFFARHGLDLAGRIESEMPPHCLDHRVMTL